MDLSGGQFPVVGILGGGQLGRMFIQAAINYNTRIHVLDPDPEAPCAPFAHEFECGSITDYDTVLAFGRKADIITIEIENVNTAALRKLRDEGKQVFPQPELIETIQDKGLQKQFFAEHNIPTSEFILLDSGNDAASVEAGAFPAFLKLRKAGYDGRGVKFMAQAGPVEGFEAPCLLEKAVDIQVELSVIVASNGKEMKCFPAAEMLFHPEANLVEFLTAPSTLPADVLKKAEELAITIAKKLELTGILAVEMFLDKNGKLLVNELAPRPHNSGHHTIEGNVTSQYEQHLRAIMGWPLGDTSTVACAVMLNLLGEPGYSGPAFYEGLEEVLKIPGTHIHLYGKSVTKPLRKMGHLTVVNSDPKEALVIAERIKNLLKIKTKA